MYIYCLQSIYKQHWDIIAFILKNDLRADRKEIYVTLKDLHTTIKKRLSHKVKKMKILGYVTAFIFMEMFTPGEMHFEY